MQNGGTIIIGVFLLLERGSRTTLAEDALGTYYPRLSYRLYTTLLLIRMVTALLSLIYYLLYLVYRWSNNRGSIKRTNIGNVYHNT
jgi:hypothetical protein